MKASIKKMGRRVRRQYRAHVRPVIQATNRELNELCEAFRWTERIEIRQGMSRE